MLLLCIQHGQSGSGKLRSQLRYQEHTSEQHITLGVGDIEYQFILLCAEVRRPSKSDLKNPAIGALAFVSGSCNKTSDTHQMHCYLLNSCGEVSDVRNCQPKNVRHL